MHNGEILKETILPSNILKSNKLEQPSSVCCTFKDSDVVSKDIDEKDVLT